jgi:hypothetical protein
MDIPKLYLHAETSNASAAHAFANLGADWDEDVWCIHDSSCGDSDCCGSPRSPAGCDDCLKTAQTNLIIDNPHLDWVRVLAHDGHHIAILPDTKYKDTSGYDCAGDGCYSNYYPCHYLLVAENIKRKLSIKVS